MAGNLLYAWFSAMHTRVDILLASDKSEQEILDCVNEVAERIVQLERMGNCFTPDSELSRLNEGAILRGEVSPLLDDILKKCDDYNEKTDGLFDVTVDGRINLSGFIKGYALDEAHHIIASHGIEDALVNMGNSSVLAMGNCQGSDGWIIQNPETGESVVLHDEVMTTSGNDTDGRRHIINPLTGNYVEGRRVATVVTSSGAEGEVLAKVRFIKVS